MITVAGALIGIALVRFGGQREGWLRAALLAQVADLVTFTAVWEHSQGEVNPLAGLVRRAAVVLLELDYHGAAVTIAAITLAALKVGLIALLVRLDPHLGPYRRIVMAVAITAGGIGTLSNVVAHPNALGTLSVVAVFAVVAVRWPARFRVALGVGARLAAATLLGIGGLAALSYHRWLAEGYGCDLVPCWQLLPPLLEALTIAFFGSALLTLWLTWRYSSRFLSLQVADAH